MTTIFHDFEKNLFQKIRLSTFIVKCFNAKKLKSTKQVLIKTHHDGVMDGWMGKQTKPKIQDHFRQSRSSKKQIKKK